MLIKKYNLLVKFYLNNKNMGLCDEYTRSIKNENPIIEKFKDSYELNKTFEKNI
jgi:hypothetical protein